MYIYVCTYVRMVQTNDDINGTFVAHMCSENLALKFATCKYTFCHSFISTDRLSISWSDCFLTTNHAWFLEIIVVCVFVCVSVCPPPRAVITSDVIWCDIGHV